MCIIQHSMRSVTQLGLPFEVIDTPLKLKQIVKCIKYWPAYTACEDVMCIIYYYVHKICNPNCVLICMYLLN